MEEYFVLVQSESGDWYMIPAALRDKWDADPDESCERFADYVELHRIKIYKYAKK